MWVGECEDKKAILINLYYNFGFIAPNEKKIKKKGRNVAEECVLFVKKDIGLWYFMSLNNAFKKHKMSFLPVEYEVCVFASL